MLRGSATAGEASGQSVVANIIRNQESDNVRWEAEFELAPDGTINPILEATYTSSIDEWETSLKLNGFKQKYPRTGTIERFTNTDDLIYSEAEDRPSTLTDIFLSGDARKNFNESVLQLNSRFGWSKFTPITDRKRFDGRLPDSNPDSSFFSDYNSQFYEGELGADFTTPLRNNWIIKLILLGTHQHWWYKDDTQSNNPVGTFSSGSRVDSVQDTYETILRSTFTKAGNFDLHPEIGGELTYNRLDGSIDILNTDASGGETSVFVPIADVTVQETRGEIFTNLLWRPTTKMSVKGGMTVETSQIKVSGDATNKQSFTYFKPSFSFAYDLSDALQVRLTARRTVGQLSFNDFVSTANVVDDRVTTGNPELQPDKTTRVSAQMDYRFSEGGSLNLELFHEWKDDVLEFILLPGDIQGIGNAGSARLWGYNIAATLPINFILNDAQVKVTAEDRKSSLLDPVTNQKRRLTNITTPKLEINFRHNLPKHKLAWGVGYIAAKTTDYFYLSEIDRLRAEQRWNAFIESSHFDRLRLRLEVSRIGKDKEKRERRFFDTTRAGMQTNFELTNRKRGTFVSLILSGQF